MKHSSTHEHPYITSGFNISYWTEGFNNWEKFSQLTSDIDTDVVVIGAGITGLSVAYQLIKSGRQVVVVDDGYPGSGETGRTTAHLVTALDDRFYDLERLFGEDKTKLIAQSHASAINEIEKIIREENIDCDFKRVDGYLFLHPSDDVENLVKELEAAKRAGLDVKLLSETPALPKAGQCIQFANQATFHPLKYLSGLCDFIQRKGGKIYTKTHAKDINTDGIVTNELFRVNARNVVVASNTPVNNLVVMHLKQYAYRSYVIGSLIPKGSLPDVLWWDTGDFNQNKNMPPYHYVRLHKYDQDHDLLICGGEDHPTGLADADDESEELKFGKLEAWAKEYFGITDIHYRWSGQVMEPMDSIAYIGRNPMDKDNVFIATGDSGNGMTHGTIAGLLISDLINERKNDWEEIYDPSRFKLFKAGNVFFKEVVGGLIAYLKSKPGDTEAEKLLTLPVGEGTIAELDGTKYGVYRDEAATLHMVTAECTHLKCIVKFNNVEKSWDCPCHGSRFTYKGEVMNGPANKNLDYRSE